MNHFAKMKPTEEPPDRLGFHIFGPIDLPFRFQHSPLDEVNRQSELSSYVTEKHAERLGAFQGGVFICDYSSAIAAAWQASDVPWSEKMLVLWADASMDLKPNSGSPASYAVVGIQGSRWAGRIGHSFETHIKDAELLAISVAIDVAIDEIKKYRAQGKLSGTAGPLVKIFSDSQDCLEQILALNKARYYKVNLDRQQRILETICEQSYELMLLGGHLALSWVPRGRVSGNKTADGVAGDARRRYEESMRRMANIADRTLVQMEEDEARRSYYKSIWTQFASRPPSP